MDEWDIGLLMLYPNIKIARQIDSTLALFHVLFLFPNFCGDYCRLSVRLRIAIFPISFYYHLMQDDK